MTALLKVDHLCAGYGDSVVLDDVSFEVFPGEVVCLLGANGAGKTTTMAVLTGLLKPFGGDVHFDGVDLLALPPHRRVSSGMALSPEGRQVFPNLTVMENLLLGGYNTEARRQRPQRLDWVFSLFPRLKERIGQHAGFMSGGEQQMLALGRALMACPRLLLLDEPSLGLAPKIVSELFQTIATIAKSGISILLVEQNTVGALSVADRGYVLGSGRIAAADTAKALALSPIVREAFMGKSEYAKKVISSQEARHA
jgi:branched-chain amino acid transport system ATP-binding protein